MLTFTRKKGESIILSLDPSIDPDTPVSQILSGQIQIKFDRTGIHSTKVSIDAPGTIKVMRSELIE